MVEGLPRQLRRLRLLVLMLYASLQLLYLFKTLLIPMGGRDPNVTIWLVHSLPLLLFLPGLWRGDYRMFTWLAFAILLYFAVTVEALFAPYRSIYHWLALILVVGLFTACLFYVRGYGQYAQARAAREGEA